MATYTLISSVTVGSGGAADIQFTSIPATYTDLLVKASLRSTSAVVNENVQIDFNSTSANRSRRELYGTGSAAGSESNASNSRLGYISGDSATASTFGNSELYIPNYAGSNNKSSSADSVAETNATGAFMSLQANLWSDSAAITSIKLYPSGGNFAQYSTAYLYGISNA